jgi:hypothetical protein
MMEFSMRNHISYTVLGVALVAGASAANAQTVITRDIADRLVETVITQQPGSMLVAQEPVVTMPGAVATAPVETVETVRTVRSTTISPRHRIVSRHVIRSRAANRVTTTRTTVTERVLPVPAVVAPPAVAAVAPPTYTDVVQGPPVAPAPAYPERLYDVVMPARVVPPPAAPVGGAMFGAGTAVPTYRYVYEPDRILVIDPYTNIAVQAIPR